MIEYNEKRAQAAVQFLVDSSYSVHHITKLRSTVTKPRAMPFKDDAECLNELLVIGRQNLKAMENLIELAEFKRGNKASYQREYMAAKRQRDRKVIELEQQLVGRKLTLDQRNALLQKQYVIWHKERDQLLKKFNGSWVERNALLKDFWATKESEIDQLLAEAKQTLDHVVKRKRVVIVERQPKTVLGAKLKEALAGRNKLTRRK